MHLQQVQPLTGAAASSHSRKGLLARFLGAPNRADSHRRPPGAASAPGAAQSAVVALAPASDVADEPAAHSSKTASNVVPRNSLEGPSVRYSIDLGLPRWESEGDKAPYETVKELGRGGNGVVTLVSDRATGSTFACKAIPKVLGEGFSDIKRKGHVDAVKREIEVLQKLKGSLDIVNLIDAYEDADNVYLVMEYCSGGELWHAIGDRHYSERTVASFMRGVLRTLAVMHSHHILHRDIKPGNFMLLNKEEHAPLKAIDFGLAVPFEPDQLPRTDLGLEGTPWYMAPETLSSRVGTASDMWAAGVMAYQLLTGRFPFDDFKCPSNPSISAIWKSVLCDSLKLDSSACAGISEEAKDFLRMLLDKNPEHRPNARDALKHPWLAGTRSDRSNGKKLARSVVQRLQRFGQRSKFKRTVLQLIARELLAQQGLNNSVRGGVGGSNSGAYQALDSLQGEDVPVKPIVVDGGAGTPMSTGDVGALQALYRQLKLEGPRAVVDRERLHTALKNAGFNLDPTEVERLIESVDVTGHGHLDKEAFVGAMIDWRQLQQSNTELWLSLAKHTFESMDKDGDGVLRVDEIISALRNKLPETEIHAAVAEALHEATAHTLAAANGFGTLPESSEEDLSGHESDGEVRPAAAGQPSSTAPAAAGTVEHWLEGSGANGGAAATDGSTHAGSVAVPLGPLGMPRAHWARNPSLHGRPRGIDFNDFVRMLKAGSVDSLDMYDDRFGQPSPSVHAPALGTSLASQGSLDRLNQMLQRAGSLDGKSTDGSSRRGTAFPRTAGLHGGYFYDSSQHSTNNGTHHGSTHGGAGGGMQFRFDVVPGAAAVAPQTASPAKPAAAPAAVPAPAAAAASFFRFDTAKDFRKPEPAAVPEAEDPTRIVFRFDIPKPSAAPPPPPVPEQQQQQENALSDNTQRGASLYASFANVVALPQSGLLARIADRSVHGLRHLETVQE